MKDSQNISMIITIAEGLGDLCSDVVFVGGSVTEFYASKKAQAEDIRFTEDVDVIIEIGSRQSYESLEAKLRSKGFINDMSSGAPICRWIFNGIRVDVMPDNSEILGFSNQWYKPGIESKVALEIDGGISINILAAPYYLATKCEAIKSRGLSDLRFSHDFEDSIFVLDNYDEIFEEILSSPSQLRRYLTDFFNFLYKRSDFREAVECAMPYGAEDRVPIIRALIQQICKLPNL